MPFLRLVDIKKKLNYFFPFLITYFFPFLITVLRVIFFTEILGAAVRRDSLIPGIQISDTECKISQYTDDTTVILDFHGP